MVAREALSFDDSTILLPYACNESHALTGEVVDAPSTSQKEDKKDECGCRCRCRYRCEKKSKKYELIDYDSLPGYLKHNEFIRSYYRSDWPWKETILSIFSIHNETINIWTHLIGFFLFLILTVVPGDSARFFDQIPSNFAANGSEFLGVGREWNGSSSYNSTDSPPLPTSAASSCIHQSQKAASSRANDTMGHLLEVITHNHTETLRGRGLEVGQRVVQEEAMKRITHWPFVVFMGGAMICLVMSSACHLLSCHSKRCSYVMLRLDYAGICTLIVTSFYPLVYYAFLCDPFFQRLYISSITLFGVAMVLISLLPAFETPNFRVARASLFFCMGLSGLVPILHKLALYGHHPKVILATAYEMAMGTFYAVGVVIYVARVPERWLPGKFDLTGHSHQLFHLLVIAGAYMHYHAGLVYLQWRDVDNLCDRSAFS